MDAPQASTLSTDARGRIFEPLAADELAHPLFTEEDLAPHRP